MAVVTETTSVIEEAFSRERGRGIVGARMECDWDAARRFYEQALPLYRQRSDR